MSLNLISTNEKVDLQKLTSILSRFVIMKPISYNNHTIKRRGRTNDQCWWKSKYSRKKRPKK
jgi:hypothetical protein